MTREATQKHQHLCPAAGDSPSQTRANARPSVYEANGKKQSLIEWLAPCDNVAAAICSHNIHSNGSATGMLCVSHWGRNRAISRTGTKDKHAGRSLCPGRRVNRRQLYGTIVLYPERAR